MEAKGQEVVSLPSKVIIDILDENDNIPEIIITSLSDQIFGGFSARNGCCPFQNTGPGVLEEAVKSPVMSEEMFLSRFLLLLIITTSW